MVSGCCGMESTKSTAQWLVSRFSKQDLGGVLGGLWEPRAWQGETGIPTLFKDLRREVHFALIFLN